MRVAVVTHLFPSQDSPGRGTFVREQVLALGRHCEVVVVVPGDVGRTNGHSAGVEVFGLGLSEPKPDSGHAAYLVWCVRYASRLWRFWSRSVAEADLIHAHFGFPDGVAAIMAATHYGKPVVVTLHGSDVSQVLGRSGLFGWAVRRVMRRADRIICVSDVMGEEVSRLLGVAGRQLVTIRNGYDGGVFRLELAERGDDLLFVGALRDVKNPIVLIRAFAAASAHISGDLIVVGEGQLLEEMREVAKSLLVGNRVMFQGRLSRAEVAAAMGRCRALVLPSKREGMPMVVMEALATGTPVVATAVGGISEVVGPESGVLLESDDVAGLADALVSVASREWDPQTVRDGSGVRSWEDSTDDLLQVYNDVLADRGA